MISGLKRRERIRGIIASLPSFKVQRKEQNRETLRKTSDVIKQESKRKVPHSFYKPGSMYGLNSGRTLKAESISSFKRVQKVSVQSHVKNV